LMHWMEDEAGQPESIVASSTQPAPLPDQPPPAADDSYLAPWIDTEKCTTCGECIQINPNIFAYNDQQKAIIKDPQGGPYKDLVKAAERCTAGIIHPGLPKERSGKEIERLIARAEKYNR